MCLISARTFAIARSIAFKELYSSTLFQLFICLSYFLR